MTTATSPIIREDILQIVAQPIPWEQFSGATVLVTGAAGFLPAYMVETLLFLNRSVLSHPVRVIALVREPKRAHQRFSEYLGRPDLQLIVQDVCDPVSFTGSLDFVIHAASQASPRFFGIDPVGTLAANTVGTYRLLTAAQDRALKGFLFLSSAEVYGAFSNSTRDVTEDDFGYLNPTDIRSCYGESKRMGETMCVAWALQYRVPTRIVRPFHTYGPRMRLDDGRVFADFVRDILSGGPIVLKSDGSALRCFCYLADATAAFFTVLLNGMDGQAYNVANPDAECSISDLADRLAELFSSRGVTVDRKQDPGHRSATKPMMVARPSVAKIGELGWSPVMDIEKGFLRTVESYRECL